MGDPILNRFVTRFRFTEPSRARREPYDLDRFEALPDRERVALRGRVRMREALPSFLSATLCTVRRLDFVCHAIDPRLNRGYVHEAGYDFDLEDAQGARVRVLVSEATIAPEPASAYEAVPVDKAIEIFHATQVPNAERYLAVRAIEYLIREGQEIDVVGTKTRIADRGGETLARETGWAMALTGEILYLRGDQAQRR